MTMTTSEEKYLFPLAVRRTMMEMHHDEWVKLKESDPVRAAAVTQAVDALREAFEELSNEVLADLFAFIVSSLKGAAERGATLSSVLNGYADICSELTDAEFEKLEAADGE
jgi:hypothetical protein